MLFARLVLEGLALLTNCEAAFARNLWDSLHSLVLRLASPAYSENRFARSLRDLLRSLSERFVSRIYGEVNLAVPGSFFKRFTVHSC
jgi:hypothetical protein